MKLAPSLGALVAIVSTTLAADAAFVGRTGGNATFTASGPAGTQIVGTTGDVAVQEDGQNIIAVTVTLGSLKTGMDLRDKHMREKYLETDRYPTAVLRVARADLKLPGPGDRGGFDADGTLALHGKTRPVHFHYEAKRDGSTFSVRGSLPLDMTDYGIEAPKYMGLSVKPKVDIAVTFTADDKT